MVIDSPPCSAFHRLVRNLRELAMGLKIPTRQTQLKILRWVFSGLYMLQGGLMTAILVQTSAGGGRWVLCSILDLVLILFFLFYCKNVSLRNVSLSESLPLSADDV
jgi:hypothetical protein